MLEEPIKLDGKSADKPMEATVKKQSVPKGFVTDSEDRLKQDYGDVIGEVSDHSGISSSSEDERDVQEPKENFEQRKQMHPGIRRSKH